MIKKVNCWGRVFDLDVQYEYYDGQEITRIQKDAENSFLEHADEILSDPSQVISYINEHDKDKIKEKITNIFKYVIPVSVYIMRSDNSRMVALLCNYRLDPEHGLAVVFENEKMKEIGAQDIAL